MTNRMNRMSRFVCIQVHRGLVFLFSFALFHLLLLGCQLNLVTVLVLRVSLTLLPCLVEKPY
jgi:hypothetical protein